MSIAVRNAAETSEMALCMGSHGYELAAKNCPSCLRLDPERLERLDREQAGQQIVAMQQLQKTDARCYVPMSWLGKQSLKLEAILGLISED